MNTDKITLYRVVYHSHKGLGLQYTTNDLDIAQDEADEMLQYRKTTHKGSVTIRKADILVDDLEQLDNDYESEVLDEDFEPKGNLILKIEWTNNDAIWKR